LVMSTSWELGAGSPEGWLRAITHTSLGRTTTFLFIHCSKFQSNHVDCQIREIKVGVSSSRGFNQNAHELWARAPSARSQGDEDERGPHPLWDGARRSWSESGGPDSGDALSLLQAIRQTSDKRANLGQPIDTTKTKAEMS
jgi:hypothetical protein